MTLTSRVILHRHASRDPLWLTDVFYFGPFWLAIAALLRPLGRPALYWFLGPFAVHLVGAIIAQFTASLAARRNGELGNSFKDSVLDSAEIAGRREEIHALLTATGGNNYRWRRFRPGLSHSLQRGFFATVLLFGVLGKLFSAAPPPLAVLAALSVVALTHLSRRTVYWVGPGCVVAEVIEGRRAISYTGYYLAGCSLTANFAEGRMTVSGQSDTLDVQLWDLGSPRAFVRAVLAASCRDAIDHHPCNSCGYDLRGQTKAQCPECGRPFSFAREAWWIPPADNGLAARTGEPESTKVSASEERTWRPSLFAGTSLPRALFALGLALLAILVSLLSSFLRR